MESKLVFGTNSYFELNDNEVLTELNQAWVEAQNGLTATLQDHVFDQSLTENEELSLTLGFKISNQFLAFYRLMLLELEALVAGLDYQVEQKTYPERLKQMAILSGFSCIDHERVHSTHGHSNQDAGTHVFAFKKR